MIAFVCNAPVQLIRAIQMVKRMAMFEDTADLYIGTMFRNYEKVAERVRETGVFRHVYIENPKELGRYRILSLLYGNSSLAQEIRYEPLDKLVSFNIESLTAQALYHLNHRRMGFEFHNVEDGPSIYEMYVPARYPWRHPYRWLGIDKECFHMNTFWCCYTANRKVPSCFTSCVRQLPQIDPADDELAELLNFVFDYRDEEILDHADVLIMEESHYTDHFMINDADHVLYEEICEHYPSLDFAVKLHPRTVQNRFSENFTVMPNTGIPWELYVLNRIRHRGKKLLQMGICCATLLSDKLLFDDESPKLVLGPLFYDKIIVRNGIVRLNEQVMQNYKMIRSTYREPDNMMITESKRQLFSFLDQNFAW